jgi:CRISPR/Cas system CSM-associated protein Csm3 (group 7 of RAMP superfamily)
MPQDEPFWNPYRLIPIRSEIVREKPVTDEKFRGISGFICCTLENLTPLFIGGKRSDKQEFLTSQGKRIIPGSSLKGMLRSLAEVVGGGCFITQRHRNNGARYDRTYDACKRIDSLCLACRMFGMMERGTKARVHRGKISIGDGVMENEKPKAKKFDIYLSNSGTRHVPFYLSPDSGQLDGKARKFYFHQPARKDSVPAIPANIRERQQITGIPALKPGHTFSFTLQFSNLVQEELELLVYCLALEPYVEVTIQAVELRLKGPLRHKIGYAKPLGLGSCHISITRFTYLDDPKMRFASLRQKGETILQGEALEKEIAQLTQKMTNDRSPTMQHLRKMLVWDESDPRVFRYPDYNWFKDTHNSQKELKKL